MVAVKKAFAKTVEDELLQLQAEMKDLASKVHAIVTPTYTDRDKAAHSWNVDAPPFVAVDTGLADASHYVTEDMESEFRCCGCWETLPIVYPMQQYQLCTFCLPSVRKKFINAENTRSHKLAEPKRPPTAFILFTNSARKGISTPLNADAARSLRVKWAAMDEIARAPYIDEAESLMRAFRRQLAEYSCVS